MTTETTSADAGNVATATTTAEAAAATTTAQTTTSTASWRDSLPDDIKSAPTLSKFETIEGMAKSYVNLERMLGADKVVVPKEGDTEGWNSFYKAAGQPEKPDEYGFKAPEKIPEGMQYDAELDTKLAAIIHKGGANKHQAAIIREGLLELVASGATANLEAAKAQEAVREQAIISGTNALKAEWGDAFEQRGQAAKKFVESRFSPDHYALLDSLGVFNNPAAIKDYYRMGTAMVGEKVLIGESTIAAPGDLDMSIADLRKNHEAALNDRSHPEHSIRLAELTRLTNARWEGK